MTPPRQRAAIILEGGPVALYYGCDPTADSLHAGNLIGLLILRRFQLAGHKPIALAGGATGMIGDPSGRSDERNLLDAPTLANNVDKISEQLRRFIDFEAAGSAQAELVDNATWTADVSLIEFLRDVGKHFTVNQMVAKESVRSRMESDSGISFTEFSYMLLQANDFAWLHQHRGCVLQIGGSDQWGNITAGIDLIRRRFARSAHGLTWPLIYRFYQYWIQSDDRDVEKFLMQLTMLSVDEVREVIRAHTAAPEHRDAQRVLAREVTGLVHGAAELAAAEEATAIVFGATDEPSQAALETLVDEIPTFRLARGRFDAGVAIVDLLAEAGVAASKGEARRLLGQGGATVGGVRPDASTVISAGDLRFGRFLLLRKGKRQAQLVVAE
ncbi:MAG: tyrosine--tRNA ligase [Actinobacteria bacterium]|nr:MAG: tyrosine--tRNA ligase [Actinomycetota bacterium]